MPQPGRRPAPSRTRSQWAIVNRHVAYGAAGKEAEIALYDPKGFEKPEGFKYKFPFRDTPFYVSADKAAKLLDFSPDNQIADDISWYYSDQYVAKGGLDKEISFSEDDIVIGK